MEGLWQWSAEGRAPRQLSGHDSKNCKREVKGSNSNVRRRRSSWVQEYLNIKMTSKHSVGVRISTCVQQCSTDKQAPKVL